MKSYGDFNEFNCINHKNGYDIRNVWSSMLFNRDGKQIKRTPDTHPYNYDTYVIWRVGGDTLPSDHGVDSDRMREWSSDGYNELCRKHFGNEGQCWNERDPKLIQKFLRDYFQNQTIVLLMIEQWCNQASGYPGWHFTFSCKGETEIYRPKEVFKKTVVRKARLHQPSLDG